MIYLVVTEGFDFLGLSISTIALAFFFTLIGAGGLFGYRPFAIGVNMLSFRLGSL